MTESKKGKINLIKDIASRRGKQREAPHTESRPLLLVLGTAAAIGLVTGTAQLAGLHFIDIASAAWDHPWPTSGAASGAAVAAAAVSQRVRAAVGLSLRWLATLVEGRTIVLLATLAVGLWKSPDAYAGDLGTNFRFVKVGLTEQATIAVMGVLPSSHITSTFPGMIVETLKWQNGYRTYVVRLVGVRRFGEPRVVNTKTCEGTVTC